MHYAPFLLNLYVRNVGDCLDAERLSAMSTSGEATKIYNARNEADCDTALGARACS